MRKALVIVFGMLLTAAAPAVAQDEGLPVPDLTEPGADLFYHGDLTMDQPPVTAKISFIYLYSNDLAAMRSFYTDLLGLSETSYREGADGWLGYKSGELQFLIFPAGGTLAPVAGWTAQPGWDGGELLRVSWSVDVGAANFRETLRRLTEAQVVCFSSEPLWCQDSYWSFPVRDPMGNTVEVYCEPPVRPQSTDWSWD